MGDLSSIPGSGGSPGEGNGNPLQYSRLESPTEEPGEPQSMVSQESDMTEGLIHMCVHIWGSSGGAGSKKKIAAC